LEVTGIEAGATVGADTEATCWAEAEPDTPRQRRRAKNIERVFLEAIGISCGEERLALSQTIPVIAPAVPPGRIIAKMPKIPARSKDAAKQSLEQGSAQRVSLASDNRPTLGLTRGQTTEEA
jgi:hypothetical protein